MESSEIRVLATGRDAPHYATLHARYGPQVAIMTILVTGGAGYIGSHMVHALVDAGERVIVVDNLATGFAWAVPKGATLVVAESGDQARLAALFAEHKVESVIHFAASVVVPDSVR